MPADRPPPPSDPGDTPASKDARGAERAAADESRPQDSAGVNVFSYLLSGVLLFGGAGWLVDRWLGTSFVVGIGTLGGTALSLYCVWVRYGSPR